MAAIIIPAHNEERNIGRLLTLLTEHDWLNHYNIYVCCNGCTDKTEEIVRSFDGVNVISTETPSKINAIRLVERLNIDYPRIYIDSDISIDKDSVIKIVDYLSDQNEPYLAVPQPHIDTSKSALAVKKFYSVWIHTTHCVDDGYGSCVFALNESARKLFDEFPEVISDDGFVRGIVPAGNISVIEGAISTVSPPKTLGGLIKIKTRSKLGNYELKQLGYDIYQSVSGKPKHYKYVGASSMFVYYFVNLISAFYAGWKLKKLKNYVWQRDDTSRQ
ncbi:Glycosyl transferase, group 2 family protein [Nitrincola lacisaponensis]|uniref:Glycosyl transferase, group 2 family protein n=1 Tax=Nitrincola lacisaponensis TaxID=267850 RepID=A0A063Y3X9_9GAMM|nr:glycosyltransferase [Nitrincola lacisaponensis]KDE39242.1 Glycosyl transferase, group 2 family protein [Nitrincola lacisaponensis]